MTTAGRFYPPDVKPPESPASATGQRAKPSVNRRSHGTAKLRALRAAARTERKRQAFRLSMSGREGIIRPSEKWCVVIHQDFFRGIMNGARLIRGRNFAGWLFRRLSRSASNCNRLSKLATPHGLTVGSISVPCLQSRAGRWRGSWTPRLNRGESRLAYSATLLLPRLRGVNWGPVRHPASPVLPP